MNNAADRNYVWGLGIQLRPAVMPYLKYRYKENAEDVLSAGLLEFATTRKPSKLAVIPTKIQVKQLREDCWKGAANLGIISAKIDEEFDSPAVIERKKRSARKIKKTITVCDVDYEGLTNVASRNAIEELEDALDAVAQLDSIVAFCKAHGLHEELAILALKYNRDWTDAEIATYLKTTLNIVQKAFRRVGDLYKAATQKRWQKEGKNAETPAGTGVRVSRGAKK